MLALFFLLAYVFSPFLHEQKNNNTFYPIIHRHDYLVYYTPAVYTKFILLSREEYRVAFYLSIFQVNNIAAGPFIIFSMRMFRSGLFIFSLYLEMETDELNHEFRHKIK